MKKLCILFDANFDDRKGLVNAVINRAKCLKQIAPYEVEVVCLQGYPAGFNSVIRKKQRKQRVGQVVIDGVPVRVLWYKWFLTDDIINHRLNYKPVLFELFSAYIYHELRVYDFVSAHGASLMAYNLFKRFGIPYSVTWHGTDIHSLPYRSTYKRRLVIRILRSAVMNFFVSNDLLSKAKLLAGSISSELSYNGVNDSFIPFDVKRRERLREQYDVQGKKVVAFVGNIVQVKNVMVLPRVFAEVRKKYKGNVVFWIIGDGCLKSQLQEAMKNTIVDCVFWGNQTVEAMPQFYNCIDVLVLPSQNEGLGMVLLEAIKCGANAVGSKVGGIPEVIGQENSFVLDEDFSENISKRIVCMLSQHVEQTINAEFSWETSVKKEDAVYKKYLLR